MISRASRFRGCMAGGLIGDCFGAPFEGDDYPPPTMLANYFLKKKDPSFKGPFLQYTDDTALSHCVARSLIELKSFDAKDMARKFVQEYYTDPQSQSRSYGANVTDVFLGLHINDFEDVFGPARTQFRGTGSYGNGAAMRIAPLALFCHESPHQLIDTAKKSALITHSHRLGYNGAILQSLAVHRALCSSEPLDYTQFINHLSDNMSTVETYTPNEMVIPNQQEYFYVKALKVVKRLLEQNETRPVKIVAALGNGVQAQYSVTTALFVFLRALTPIENIDTGNAFERTIRLAISLGGDTDTIATMAGSIAGAFYGEDKIPLYMIKHCEAAENNSCLADVMSQLVDELKK